jgi:hypothetical protein
VGGLSALRHLSSLHLTFGSEGEVRGAEAATQRLTALTALSLSARFALNLESQELHLCLGALDSSGRSWARWVPALCGG